MKILKEKFHIIILLIVFAIMIFSFLNGNVLEEGDDAEFHLARIKDLALNIKNLNIPYYFSPYKLEGYGSADVTFYPYATLYVPAFIYLLCNNLILSFKIWIFIAAFLTVYLMYISTYEIFDDKNVALLSTIFYSLSRIVIFNLHNIYDIAQAFGIAFFPLLIAGAYNLYFKNKNKWYYIVISASFLIESHVISAFFAFLFFLTVTVFCVKKIFTDREVLKKLLISTFLIIVLNIGFIYPFVYEYFYNNEFVNIYKLFATGLGLKNITEAFSLIPALPGELNIKYFKTLVYNHNATFSLFETVMLLVAVFYILCVNIKNRLSRFSDSTTDTTKATTCLFIFIFYIISFMGVWLFIPFTRNITNLQQFNYRILLRSLPFYAMLLGFAFSKIFKNKKWIVALIIALLFIDNFSDNMRNIIRFDYDYVIDEYPEVGLKRMALSYTGAMHLNRGENSLKKMNEDYMMNMYYDYVPFTENTQKYMDGIIYPFNLDIQNEKKGLLSYELDYEKKRLDYESYIIFPFYNIRGFNAKVDDKNILLKKKSHGLVQVMLTKLPDKGHLSLTYERPRDFLIAFYVSLVSYILLFIYIIKKKIICRKGSND